MLQLNKDLVIPEIHLLSPLQLGEQYGTNAHKPCYMESLDC